VEKPPTPSIASGCLRQFGDPNERHETYRNFPEAAKAGRRYVGRSY
jgi:hypothetical protein